MGESGIYLEVEESLSPKPQIVRQGFGELGLRGLGDLGVLRSRTYPEARRHFLLGLLCVCVC